MGDCDETALRWQVLPEDDCRNYRKRSNFDEGDTCRAEWLRFDLQTARFTISREQQINKRFQLNTHTFLWEMLSSARFFVQSREHSDVYACPCRTSCRLSREDLETDLVQHPAGHGVSKKQLPSLSLSLERRLRTFTFIHSRRWPPAPGLQ